MVENEAESECRKAHRRNRSREREKTEADEEDRGGERRKVHMNFIWTSYKNKCV